MPLQHIILNPPLCSNLGNSLVSVCCTSFSVSFELDVNFLSPSPALNSHSFSELFGMFYFYFCPTNTEKKQSMFCLSFFLEETSGSLRHLLALKSPFLSLTAASVKVKMIVIKWEKTSIDSLNFTKVFETTSHIYSIFSSPEHKVLRVSYCDRSLSVVRRRPSSVVRRPSSVVRRP